MPEGIRWNTKVSRALTTVWPALDPPWKRTTTSASRARMSTILPLPSSPHCVPTTMRFGMSHLSEQHAASSKDANSFRLSGYLLLATGCLLSQKKSPDRLGSEPRAPHPRMHPPLCQAAHNSPCFLSLTSLTLWGWPDCPSCAHHDPLH